MSSDHDSRPDRKRTRVHSNDDAKVFVDHPSLYFEDGNVILKCGKTLFCVHRTLLAKHSQVFRNIFTAPADGRPQESFRKCLFVSLQDAVDDMECLLNIIYDGLHIDFQSLHTENFPMLAGLLRMSTKYKLERPRAAILDWLRLQWPSTLPKYEEKMASMSKRVGPSTEARLDLHPASIITLLHECDYDSPDLLVPLFYHLSTLITQFTSPPTGHNISALSPADTERFIIGVNKLRSLHTASSQCPVYTVVHAATDSQQAVLCQYELLRYWHNIVGPRLFDVKTQMCQPIEDWGELCRIARVDGIAPWVGPQGDTGSNGMCKECKAAVLEHMDLTRQKMWGSLGELFGFDVNG